MSKQRTSTISRNQTDWDQFDALKDSDISKGIEQDPDARATDNEFWKTADLILPQPKETITIRLDGDVLQWFREKGKGYQTRINAILRAYMQTHQDEHL